MIEEVWKDIKGYEGLYQVSNLGRVKSLERTIKHKTCYGGFYHVKGKILKPKIDKDGYFRIGLKKDKIKKYYFIHRLVAITFINNPNNFLQVNHKDENKRNNQVNNLEWCNSKYNINYGNGIKKSALTRSKKIIQYDLNNNYIKTWDTMNDAIRFYNGNTQICQCCKGKRKNANGYKWKYANELEH
jgi:hypothetical protein